MGQAPLVASLGASRWLRPCCSRLCCCSSLTSTFFHFSSSILISRLSFIFFQSQGHQLSGAFSTFPPPYANTVFHRVCGAAAPTAALLGALSPLHRGGQWVSEKWRNWTTVTLFVSSRPRTRVLTPGLVCGSIQALTVKSQAPFLTRLSATPVLR